MNRAEMHRGKKGTGYDVIPDGFFGSRNHTLTPFELWKFVGRHDDFVRVSLRSGVAVR